MNRLPVLTEKESDGSRNVSDSGGMKGAQCALHATTCVKVASWQIGFCGWSVGVLPQLNHRNHFRWLHDGAHDAPFHVDPVPLVANSQGFDAGDPCPTGLAENFASRLSAGVL